jgi:serine phosphatase RsbU (regulator of sigma subunit)
MDAPQATTHAQLERRRRALHVLYTISEQCRGQTQLRRIFAAIAEQLQQLFPYDACYVAVCDQDRTGTFRAALLIDEEIETYEEASPYGALTRLLVERQEPLLFADLAAERAQLGQPTAMFGHVEKQSRAWLGVPLLFARQTVGVISLQSYQHGVYSVDDLDLLQQVGNLAAIVIENAALAESQRVLSETLAEQVAARTRELGVLGDVAAEMVRERRLPELLQRTVSLAIRLLGSDAAVIRLIDSATGELDVAVQHGMPEAYIRERGRMAVRDTYIGQAIEQNRPLAFAGGELAALQSRGLPFRSLVSVPLCVAEQTIGGMSLLSMAEQPVSQQQLDVVAALANQVAIAIENARLFAERERRVSELTALSLIARSASTALDVPSMQRAVYTALTQFIPLDAFTIVSYDPQRQVITDGISIDEGQEYRYWQRQPPPPDSLTAWVLRRRQTLHFDDLPNEIARHPDLALQHTVGLARHAVSWLGLPLLNRDHEAIGAISVQSYHADAFSDNDVRLLTNIASQIALHAQHMSLLARRERQIRELDAIGQISRSINAAPSLQAMLRPTYETLQRVTDASSFFLVICDPLTGLLTHSYYIDGGEEVDQTWPDDRPPPGSLTAWILAHGSPLLFDDITLQAERLAEIGVRPFVYGSDDRPRSWTGVPLLSEDAQPIGVLALQDSRAYQYDEQTIEFLSQVASHLSIGVQKVRLFAAEQAARRTADTLREVARVLNSTFDPDEVLEIILRELQRVVPYDAASLMLLENGRLRLVARRGAEGAVLRRSLTLPRDQDTAAAHVVRTGAPLLIADTQLAPEWHADRAGERIRSWLGVPLAVKGRVVGVLNIDSRTARSFIERDQEVALAFANQAAVALENARLYAESVLRFEQELMIARQIQSNLFPRSLPQIAHVQVAARCLPAREMGGDFYDCFMIDEHQPGLLAILVGDASGKSVPGAMLMAIARSVARSEARDHAEPETVMRETNRLMAQDVPRGSFVALNYATLDLRRRRLAMASAGQLTPLLRRRDRTVRYLEPPGPVLPLGIFSEIDYAALSYDLEPGDTLLFLTDGVVEAQNPERELFGFERLERLVHAYGDRPPEILVDIILRAVEDFCAGRAQHDDMTLVVVQLGT